eukprot:CAMPEP_0168591684 /NCGR_PEP_ID=MMETSP0420-20121227/7277_1 /TAXON_ID=498008 /ORGANISM="Pessonella sp." /LENGTH=126 /DNA_ID=CAMNT_0008627515 /DNA_START=240 /DNA_END=620 /DNA_ORIENTATION=-
MTTTTNSCVTNKCKKPLETTTSNACNIATTQSSNNAAAAASSRRYNVCSWEKKRKCYSAVFNLLKDVNMSEKKAVAIVCAENNISRHCLERLMTKSPWEIDQRFCNRIAKKRAVNQQYRKRKRQKQ